MRRCWTCGELHSRQSKYCSRACLWHDRKYLCKTHAPKEGGGVVEVQEELSV
jgi:hypothetical protein